MRVGILTEEMDFGVAEHRVRSASVVTAQAGVDCRRTAS
jgi:hypothetical protein